MLAGAGGALLQRHLLCAGLPLLHLRPLRGDLRPGPSQGRKPPIVSHLFCSPHVWHAANRHAYRFTKGSCLLSGSMLDMLYCLECLECPPPLLPSIRCQSWCRAGCATPLVQLRPQLFSCAVWIDALHCKHMSISVLIYKMASEKLKTAEGGLLPKINSSSCILHWNQPHSVGFPGAVLLTVGGRCVRANAATPQATGRAIALCAVQLRPDHDRLSPRLPLLHQADCLAQ